MGGRPPKPFSVITTEKKSHRTKAELDVRQKGETALLTGTSLKAWPEVKKNKVANKEFNRIRKLLKKINHDDALYEAVINRYCILTAETKEIDLTIIPGLRSDLQELVEKHRDGHIDFIAYLDRKDRVQGFIIAWDKKLMDKRKMLLQIEKENIMTVLAALRAVPKEPQQKKKSGMGAFLERRQAK